MLERFKQGISQCHEPNPMAFVATGAFSFFLLTLSHATTRHATTRHARMYTSCSRLVTSAKMQLDHIADINVNIYEPVPLNVSVETHMYSGKNIMQAMEARIRSTKYAEHQALSVVLWRLRLVSVPMMLPCMVALMNQACYSELGRSGFANSG